MIQKVNPYLATFLALGAVLLPVVCRADQAIVVGVNQYSQLVNDQGNHPNVAGCVNDAQAWQRP